jgi:peptidoglycan hydrolase-like protein with peptidoglycan-binding domain
LSTNVDQKGKTNMRTHKGLLAPGVGLLGVAMLAAPALASDSKGGFALHGVGAQTCQVMLQELKLAAPAPSATPATVPPASAPSAPPVATAPSPASSAASPAVTTATANASPPTAAPAASTIASTPATPAPGAAAAAQSMRPILTSWIMGYLTASDRLARDTFDETPVMAPEALTTMIIGVCNRNPDARVETVANNVFTQLAAARIPHESPIVEARAGDRMVLIRKATLVAMQNSLVKDKLMKEPADGTFGSSTSTALLAFQKSQNLPATGLPDASTVVRLLIEMPSKVAAK